MASRIGVWLLLIGVFAAVLATVQTAGNVVAPDFNGWRVAFHGGVLAIALGAATIAVEPTKSDEVLTATAFGVFGQVGVAVGLVAIEGENGTLFHTLFWQVLPLVPMSIGYIIGGLHSVDEPFERQSYSIASLSVIGGAVVLTGSYALYVVTHETIVAPYHAGFLSIGYAVVLVTDIFGATFLYALWRVSERLAVGDTVSASSEG